MFITTYRDGRVTKHEQLALAMADFMIQHEHCAIDDTDRARILCWETKPDGEMLARGAFAIITQEVAN